MVSLRSSSRRGVQGLGKTACLLVFVALAALGQPDKSQDITGIWEGRLSIADLSLRLVFHINRGPEKQLTASADSLDEGLFGLRVDKAEYTEPKLTLTLSDIRGRFEAKLGDEGRVFDGNWFQNGMQWPLRVERVEKASELRRPQEPKSPFPYLVEDVSFSHDSITLAGTLTLPQGQGPFPAVVLISGSGPQNRDEEIFGHKPFLVLADYLTRRGIAVLRYDDRGTGSSTGSFRDANLGDFAEDAHCALKYLKSRTEVDERWIGLIGHSEGGCIAPLIAERSADPAFLILLAGPGIPGDEILMMQNETLLRANGLNGEALEKQLKFRKSLFDIAKSDLKNEAVRARIDKVIAKAKASMSQDELHAAGLADDSNPTLWHDSLMNQGMRSLLAYDPRPVLARASVPILSLIGEKDFQVPPEPNQLAIGKALAAGGHDSHTLITLPGLNHLFQTANTGLLYEYGRIEETFAPIALETIGSWIESELQKGGKPTPEQPAKVISALPETAVQSKN